MFTSLCCRTIQIMPTDPQKGTLHAHTLCSKNKYGIFSLNQYSETYISLHMFLLVLLHYSNSIAVTGNTTAV